MRRFRIERPHDAAADPPPAIKIVSWNLLHSIGASMHDVVGLIRQEQPDLLLMQEATPMLDGITSEVGGHYARTLQPGRRHGLATWSRREPVAPVMVIPLPPDPCSSGSARSPISAISRSPTSTCRTGSS